jgi:hypothetical protein
VRRYHLAQLNIGRFRAPLEEPMMEGFRTELDPINALADRAPGFVWRFQTDEGNASHPPVRWRRLMAVNMSVGVARISQFRYKSQHSSRCGGGSRVRAARGRSLCCGGPAGDSDRCRAQGGSISRITPDGTRLHVPRSISGAR